MGHDVFISHSSLDKLAADAVCHGLEARGIRCWMAPRDQIAGRPYGEQITAAISGAQVMVLVFSQNVNNSQAVLNEINIAAGSNVTIVPFRIAQADFSAELNFYLGRMHWLDAFPQPVDAYIDALVATIQRNLKPADPGAQAGVAPAPEVSPPPSPSGPAPPQPPGGWSTSAPVAQPRAGPSTGVIIAGVLGALFLVLLIVIAWPRPPNPVAAQAANTVVQAIANSIARNADDGDDDKDDGAKAAAASAALPRGDGSELTAVRAANPSQVAYYETRSAPGGPPAQLDGAKVIATDDLLAKMKARDAGSGAFLLVDARGCGGEPSIPTAVCLSGAGVDALEDRAPDKSTELVIFCHDGGCPLSYQLASAAVAAGYRRVRWYRGGVNAWAASGEPTSPIAGAGE